jgi:multimeric flavodoxin WrbA
MGTGILIVNGSPRAQGNTAYLASVAAQALTEAGRASTTVRLAGLSIAPCSGCDACRSGKARYCAIDDDMAGLYDKVAACEAILFASPVYWFSYTAQLKAFVDRLYGLWNWNHDFLKDKKAAAILVYGDDDLYASGGINAVSSFEHMLRFLGARSVGFAYGTANDPGDAAANEGLVARTKALALKLA